MIVCLRRIMLVVQVLLQFLFDKFHLFFFFFSFPVFYSLTGHLDSCGGSVFIDTSVLLFALYSLHAFTP